MGSSFWERIVQKWSTTYYTIPMWYCCSMIAFILGLKNFKKEKIYILMISYVFISILCLIVWDYVAAQLTQKMEKTVILEGINTLFSLFEITIFYVFFDKVIKSKKAKFFTKMFILLVYLLSLIFFILAVTSQFTYDKMMAFSFRINILEFFLLLLLCLFFFYEFFDENKIQLSSQIKKASVIITTGLFLYTLTSLPFFLIGDKLYSFSIHIYYIMFSIHYISICFLFICLAKAFTCKTSLTT
ncbi:MAG: hypothetical protein ABIT05_13765 [Chitinophagaceae bacterium]